MLVARAGHANVAARDLLGRMYEYFLGQFAGSEGKRGGEFYTPPFGRAQDGGNARTLQRPRLTDARRRKAGCVR